MKLIKLLVAFTATVMFFVLLAQSDADYSGFMKSAVGAKGKVAKGIAAKDGPGVAADAMRTILLLLAFTSLTFGQDRDRVFYLTHTPTIQQFQEVATVIRTMTDIREATLNNEQKSVTVHAAAGQIAIAEWLFNELDSPAVQPSVLHEYRVPGATDDVVRLFYLTQTPTVQDFQEAATLVRTIAGFTRAFTYNEPRAFVVRGTAAQIGLAEWLVKQLDPAANPSSSEYRMPGTND